ncbi:hypothetical protein AZI86_13035 [Bdellovibrio bacteriovorus]|uniref:Uncharacterized protein n=1 Tax=Bdellovibrio bacteriovorus TaxID=959 RepID=A0A150WJD9_BDEBC|nr:hypothetical protein [Bdellovibrio bacteriovorus]KYG63743.1 hypothetical protein AZI86_13035 [Bdellovibrio bacteriovorus]
MKISRLLELHQQHQSQGLFGSFGDGYLVAHNRVFRGVRTMALAAGYKFSDSRDEAYDAFPLLQLDRILESKTLPYANNVVPFESLTSAQQELISWDDVDGNLKRNFVFHEGSHAVFRSLKPAHRSEDVSVQVVWMLLEESFANTMELLAVIDAGDAAHRIFFELNSYVCEFDHRHHLLKALTEFGEKVLVPFMVLSYLHSNFLREKIEDKDFNQIFKMLSLENLSDTQIKTLRALSKVVFNLSERFRYQTTDFHLRLAGVKNPYELLYKTDFLKICALEEEISKVISKISSMRF